MVVYGFVSMAIIVGLSLVCKAFVFVCENFDLCLENCFRYQKILNILTITVVCVQVLCLISTVLVFALSVHEHHARHHRQQEQRENNVTR
jgi:hypothetical protein